MLVSGCLIFCGFVFLEFRVVRDPIVPSKLTCKHNSCGDAKARI